MPATEIDLGDVMRRAVAAAPRFEIEATASTPEHFARFDEAFYYFDRGVALPIEYWNVDVAAFQRTSSVVASLLPTPTTRISSAVVWLASFATEAHAQHYLDTYLQDPGMIGLRHGDVIWEANEVDSSAETAFALRPVLPWGNVETIVGFQDSKVVGIVAISAESDDIDTRLAIERAEAEYLAAQLLAALRDEAVTATPPPPVPFDARELEAIATVENFFELLNSRRFEQAAAMRDVRYYLEDPVGDLRRAHEPLLDAGIQLEVTSCVPAFDTTYDRFDGPYPDAQLLKCRPATFSKPNTDGWVSWGKILAVDLRSGSILNDVAIHGDLDAASSTASEPAPRTIFDPAPRPNPPPDRPQAIPQDETTRLHGALIAIADQTGLPIHRLTRGTEPRLPIPIQNPIAIGAQLRDPLLNRTTELKLYSFTNEDTAASYLAAINAWWCQQTRPEVCAPAIPLSPDIGDETTSITTCGRGCLSWLIARWDHRILIKIAGPEDPTGFTKLSTLFETAINSTQLPIG